MDNKTLTFIEVIAYIVGLLGIGSGVFSFLRYGNYKTTVKLQNDSIKALQDNNLIIKDELQKSRDEVKQSRLDSAKEIGVLEGQVKLYRDLQLDKMAIAMIDISGTNQQILETLRTSASIAVVQQNDGGLKVRPSAVDKA